MIHMNKKNFTIVDPAFVLSFFHFFPLFFFFILFIYLLLFSSFYSSLSFTFIFPSSPSISCSTPSLFCCNLLVTKFLQVLSYSSICFSMFLCVNNSNTSCLFFFTLLITGIKKRSEMTKALAADINKYKKIDMLNCLLFSDSSIIASVELLNALRTLLRQF